MDYHSKNVYLIGVLYIVNCSLLLLSVVLKCITYLTNDENDTYEDRMYFAAYRSDLQNQLIYGGIAVLLASLAAVMIRGVVKKSHKLIAPFLMVHLLICGSIILYTLLQSVIYYHNSLSYLYSLGDTSLAIAIPTAFLYPICTLFQKFRSQIASKRRMEISTVDCAETTDEIKN